MNNTPTPRTDEQINSKPCTRFEVLGEESWRDVLVPSSFARELERELTAVTKERDRLAEAFQDMLNDTLTPTNDEWIVTDNENYIEIASIKTCDSIASVHGGKTIGDQYDLAGRIARVPQLERELIAAREEIEMMSIRYAAAEMHHANNMQEVTEQRDGLHELHNKNAERSKELLELCGTLRKELSTITKQRDLLIEVLEITLNSTALNHRNERWHSDAEYALQLIKSSNQPTEP